MRPMRPAFSPRITPLLALLTVIGVTTARGQAPAPAPAQDQPAAVDLAARFRLIERYTTKDEAKADGAIGQYQVAYRETITTLEDNPRGAPKKAEFVRQARVVERPAEIGQLDERTVVSLIRQYESVKVVPDPWVRPEGGPKPFEGLTAWYHHAATLGDKPQVIVLAPAGRELLEQEFRFAINGVYLPEMAFLLSDGPLHLGDAWRVAQEGASALVGDEVAGGQLTAKLVDLKPDPKVPDGRAATIEVTGRVGLGPGETAVRAQIQFVGRPLPASAAAPKGEAEKTKGEGVIELHGGIDIVRLAQETRIAGTTGGPPGRTLRRELVLERRRPGEIPLLTLPKSSPLPTPENSWLTYNDSKGRFTFRHPQDLLAPPDLDTRGNPNEVALVRDGPEGRDVVALTYLPKETTKPETLIAGTLQDFRKQKLELLSGPARKLPADEWPNLAVYFQEAAITGAANAAGASRMHVFCYVLQYTQDVALFVRASTYQDPATPFRKELEAILRSYRLGPAAGR